METQENLIKLDNRREELLKEVDELIKLKKMLYSNVDIESPMSDDEKELNRKISAFFSEINKIVMQINLIKYPKLS